MEWDSNWSYELQFESGSPAYYYMLVNTLQYVCQLKHLKNTLASTGENKDLDLLQTKPF